MHSTPCLRHYGRVQDKLVSKSCLRRRTVNSSRSRVSSCHVPAWSLRRPKAKELQIRQGLPKTINMDQLTQNEIQPLNITPEIEYTIGMIKTSAITSMQRFFELQQSTNNDIHAKTDTQLRASKDTMMDDLRALRRGLDRVGSAENQRNHRIHFVKCSL